MVGFSPLTELNFLFLDKDENLTIYSERFLSCLVGNPTFLEASENLQFLVLLLKC